MNVVIWVVKLKCAGNFNTKKFLNLLVVAAFLSLSLFGAIDDDCIAYAQHELLKDGRLTTVLFTPESKVKKILLGLIYNEKSTILMAQYRVTDKDIAHALCCAHKRGVLVKGITDASCFDDRYQKINQLKDNQIAMRCYKVPFSIMHNKFFVFGKNFSDKRIIWTGSANATYSGVNTNCENVLITDDKLVVDCYVDQFNKLWQKTCPHKETIAYRSKRQIQKSSVSFNKIKSILRLGK